MQLFRQIGSGMPNLHIFVEEIVALLGAMSINGYETFLCGWN